MLTLLSPFLKGMSAKVLGICVKDNVGYVQYPDPGEPYTCGGTVIFELRRGKSPGLTESAITTVLLVLIK